MAYTPALLWVVSWMAVAEVGVRRIPLPRLARALGAPVGTDAPEPAGAPLPFLTARQRRRLRAVEVVGARWPFSAGPCLRQALVSGRVLRRHGAVLRIGAVLEGSDVVGHAWVEAGGAVVGYSPRFDALQRGALPGDAT